jgi:hypothetical protein
MGRCRTPRSGGERPTSPVVSIASAPLEAAHICRYVRVRASAFSDIPPTGVLAASDGGVCLGILRWVSGEE